MKIENNVHPESPLTVGEHFAAINGITMHYHVRGNGPVLLLPSPGWGPSVAYIMPLPVFEKYFTVVYFDTRHSGLSTGPEDPEQYAVENFVADMEALRQHLGQEKVFIAGHSAGGHQVLAYGIRYNNHLLGIIAIDAIAAADGIRADEVAKRMVKKRNKPFYMDNPDAYENAAAVMFGKDTTARSLEEMINIIGGFYFYDPELAGPAFENLELNEQVFKYTQASGFQGKNLLTELSRITVPTLLIAGDDDCFCDPITQSARIHEHIVLSKLVLIQNCGHFPWIEKPDEFYQACKGWFEELNLSVAG